MAAVVLMSIGDCLLPEPQLPPQLLGPREELRGQCNVRSAKRLKMNRKNNDDNEVFNPPLDLIILCVVLFNWVFVLAI